MEQPVYLRTVVSVRYRTKIYN